MLHISIFVELIHICFHLTVNFNNWIHLFSDKQTAPADPILLVSASFHKKWNKKENTTAQQQFVYCSALQQRMVGCSQHWRTSTVSDSIDHYKEDLFILFESDSCQHDLLLLSLELPGYIVYYGCKEKVIRNITTSISVTVTYFLSAIKIFDFF